MAIKVKCNCGKVFGAPEKYAGKQVKCPDCGEPLTIPDAAAAPTKSTAIQVECECGKTVAVKAELAGKRIKCPSCSQPISIPAATAVGASATKSKKRATRSAAGQKDAGSIGDLLDEVDLSATSTGQRCPECRAEMGPDDILCVQCGYRIDRGSKMEMKRVVKPQSLSLKAGPAVPARKSDAPIEAQAYSKYMKQMGQIYLVLFVIGMIGTLFIVTGSAELLAVLPKEALGALTGVLVVYGGFAALMIWVHFWASKKIEFGSNLGRIVGIVLSILGLAPPTTVHAILCLMKAFSPEVTNYCTK
jgi:hypothetical protein